MDQIRAYFENLAPLSEDEWGIMRKGFLQVKCSKGELILSQGDECDFVAFVEKGIFRYYHVKDGKEKVNDFWFTGEFFSDYRSYLTHSPSYNYIESMREGVIWKLKRSYLLEVYEKYPSLNVLGRKITEQIFLIVASRLDEIHHNTPKEHYLNILKRHPKFVQEIPQYMLASYLGISPESLSRLRKRI